METLGFRKDFEEHKKIFKESFDATEAIALCPTCTVFLEEGHDVQSKHILQVIVDKVPEANLGTKVTFHDSCDFSRGRRILDEPRDILKKLGCDLTEMEHCREDSLCCGGGGGILMSDSPLSDRMALNRIREAIDTGAEICVTSCPTCETVLKKAAKTVAEEGKPSITVRNIEDLIWKGLKS